MRILVSLSAVLLMQGCALLKPDTNGYQGTNALLRNYAEQNDAEQALSEERAKQSRVHNCTVERYGSQTEVECD